MNRLVTRLIFVAGVMVAAPAFAHGPAGGDMPHGMSTSHETNMPQGKVENVKTDISRDDTKLTADQTKLNALQIQQAQSTVGKAPPLTVAQQRDLKALQGRIQNLDKDISRDNQRLAQDKMPQKTWEQQAGLADGHTGQP